MTGARALATARRRAAADRTEQATSRRRKARRVALAAATAFTLAATLTACHTQRWQSQLVSVNAAGTDSANGPSSRPLLSRDGTKVLFQSDASNLGPTDTNGVSDIYVRDLTTGVTELVSVNAAGNDSGNGVSYFPQISRDGTKVAFYSQATNLASPAPGGPTQVYVRDLVADTTVLASVSADGTRGADNQGVDSFRISPDGRRVMFGSNAGNLAPPFTPGVHALYERDLSAGATTRLAEGHTATYSPSGDAVAFYSNANLYLRDAGTGTITLLAGGPPGSLLKGAPVFSHDGTKVAFERETQPDWVRGDIYVYDRVARSTTLVTRAVGGSGGSDNTPSKIHGFHPTDANRLLFSSVASNLVPNDTNRTQDLFVRNLSQATTTRVVSDVGGVRSGDDSPNLAAWVGNGTKIAFVSRASNLGVNDTNGMADVYTLRLGDGSYELVSESGPGHDSGNGDSGVFPPPGASYVAELSVSGGGTRIAFGSDAGNLGPTDSDRSLDHDIYMATLVTAGS